jgi:hypothetical protein
MAITASNAHAQYGVWDQSSHTGPPPSMTRLAGARMTRRTRLIGDPQPASVTTRLLADAVGPV